MGPPLPTMPPLSLSSRRPLSPTPTPTVLPTTTPRPTSTLLRPLMPTVLSVALTPSPSPTAGSRPSPTPPTTSTATSPRCPTLEKPSTPLPLLVDTPVRPALKPSLCFVNIYLCIENTQKL